MEIELDFSSERQKKKSFKTKSSSFPGEEDELSRGELQEAERG